MGNKKIVEVPDGFKIDSAEVHEDKVVIVFSPKVVKDFKWYKATYLKEFFITATINNLLIEKFAFEYRIGLFKFICDDLGVEWYVLIYSVICGNIHFNQPLHDKYIKLLDILPKEFIESLKK